MIKPNQRHQSCSRSLEELSCRQGTGLVPALALGLTMVLGAAQSATAQTEDCAVFRQGSLTEARVAIYEAQPSENPEAFRWLDVRFRREYAEGGGPAWRPDGLPGWEMLFILMIDDGQPPPSDWASRLPQEVRSIRILLSGLPFLPLERVIAAVAFAPPGASFARTGEHWGDYERVVVEGRRLTFRPADDIFINEDGGRLASILACRPYGSVPNPGCSIYDETSDWEIKISFDRADVAEDSDLAQIRDIAIDFVNCLAVEE